MTLGHSLSLGDHDGIAETIPYPVVLTTDTELLDDCAISFDVFACEIVEHATTLTYQHLKRSFCTIILSVDL